MAVELVAAGPGLDGVARSGGQPEGAAGLSHVTPPVDSTGAPLEYLGVNSARSGAPASTLGLCQWKRPRAVEDFRSRAKETYRVIPPRCDRQAVLDLAVAPAELDGDRTIRTLFRGNAVVGNTFFRWCVRRRYIRHSPLDGAEKAIEPTCSRGHRGEVSGRLAPRRTTGTITL